MESFTRSYGNQDDEAKARHSTDDRIVAAVEPTILEDEQLEVAPLRLEDLARSSTQPTEEQNPVGSLPPSAFETPVPSSKQRPAQLSPSH